MSPAEGHEGDAVTVNGIVVPTLHTETGTLERWRLLNASPSRYYRTVLVDHTLHLVGTDGTMGVIDVA